MTDYSLSDFKESAREYALKLNAYNSGAFVIALHGDLGAGKTTFAQALARTLGVTGEIVSPTFVIQKNYPLEDQSFSQLIHIDAYRLEEEREMEVLGWNDIIIDPSNLILVEWPEKIDGLLPQNTKHIYFEYMSDTTRNISYDTEA
ncbi:MAG: tRNA (adenosine(37)-N6)-threonylcarbamoyltransferase complex ATPase subunit type 1 TsaE [Parcubacteria group bacterium]|jgi:tRNA threonylcarbamoyladenosine biosynthesis protein TsaE|nr:tRNA (adenosine(37)-N6)-threonylcarbamoyltransferase complex ATPase subunit type 1 TsaE [Parcubacteria group bacterium]|tara:strand:- start:205 stop:642 length:438 start_codon:yes stop_codon:yes gene_type:complete